MTKYSVHVTRTGYAQLTLSVEAKNKKEAKDKALEEAGNHVFSEHDADYLIENITEEE